MPVEVESSGQIEEFLGVLKRRLWVIVLPAALSTAIGVCFSVLVPKKYVVETRVLVRNTIEGADGGAIGGANSAREAQVAREDIRADPRIRAVVSPARYSAAERPARSSTSAVACASADTSAPP